VINHIRTLLMNRTRDGFPRDYPGEEYIEREFVPKKLNLPLRLAYQTLFGGDPDRLFLNYRMQQLMTLLHSTELEEFVLAKDSRVTYLPFDEEMFDQTFKIEVKQIVGSGDDLFIAGTHEANEGAGQIEQLWDVLVTADDQVRVDKRRPPLGSLDHEVSFDAQLSTPVELTGTGLRVQLRPAAIGTRWTIKSVARPQTDLGPLMVELENSFGERGVQEVFRPLAPEPIATWGRIWFQHHLSAYRYSALLLALAERIEQMPQDA